MSEVRASGSPVISRHAGERWWQRSVAYQIYPRSFCDSNGDGIGDLRGITSKLDHLQALGVEVVWLSPIYDSPNDDNGYDIRDYCAVHPEFGTLADFDEMLAQMHARGIRLMMDLVVNHCSDEHAWFRAASASRDSPYHDYFIWQPPVAGRPDGRREPTNWEAAFNGSVWRWNEATGEYALHMFSPRQPDLNWEHPPLRQEVWRLMRFWLDRGVDGFRMDVINLISKPWTPDGRLPDVPVVRPGFLQPAFHHVTGGPRFVEYLQEMQREVLQHYDTITVGEMPCVTPAQAQVYTDAQMGTLDMVFQFEHVDLDVQPGEPKWFSRPLHLPDLKHCLARWQTALHGRGWNSLYLGNHDQPRAVSRFGDDGPWRVRSAQALGMTLHGLQGTPYIYQGEELGMTNVAWPDIGHYRDIETLNWWAVATGERGLDPAEALAGIHAKSRDNARTPMPWTAAPGAGFTTGTPWLPLNANHTTINAEQALADPGSVFHLYRRMVALRREQPLLVHGRFELLAPEHPQLFAYLRRQGDEALLVLANWSGAPVSIPPAVWASLPEMAWAVLLANRPLAAGDAALPALLQPWEARWVHGRHADPVAP